MKPIRSSVDTVRRERRDRQVHEPNGPPPSSTQPVGASLRERGRAALLRGDVAQALQYLRHAVQESSEQPAAWQLLGRCFEEIGEEQRARRCYTLAARQAIKAGLDPDELRRLGAAPLYCFVVGTSDSDRH